MASLAIYAVGYNDAKRKEETAKVAISVTPTAAAVNAAVNAAELQDYVTIANDGFHDELEYADRGERGGPSHFVPRQDYLDRLRTGGPVDALSGLSLQPWTNAMRPAVLDVKLVNNSDQTVFVTEAVLEVRSSRPDLRPVLVPTVLLDRFRRLTIVDYGWATARDVSVTAKIGGRPSRPAVMKLGTLRGSAEADLTPVFRQAGFDIAALKRLESSAIWSGTPSEIEQKQADLRRLLAPFGLDPVRRVEMPVDGRISYFERNSGQRRSIDFSAQVPATQPGGLGDYQPPTATYRTVELAMEGKGYERHVPVAQRLQPGATDRFEIPVYTDRSSHHDFRIRLTYGERSVVSPSIRLDLFVPRNPQ